MKCIFYILPTILIMTGCYSSRNTNPAGSPGNNNSDLGQLAESSTMTETYCLDLSDREDLTDSTLYNKTTILDYTLYQACCCVKYQYSGCAEGEPELFIDKPAEIEGPNRPEVMSYLLVKNAGLCESLITDSTCFSMKRMQLIGNEVLLKINTEENNVLVKARN